MSTAASRIGAFLLVLGVSSTALAAPPAATTTAATSITTTTAILNGTGTPNGEPTTGWFRYSTVDPGTCNDTFGIRVPATSGTDLGMGLSAVPYGINAIGLTPGTTYYYCSIVSNASGTAFGGVVSFTTPAPPVVTTDAATLVTSSSATLNGNANPNASSSTGWFRYSTSNPVTCTDSFGTRAPSSSGSSLGMGTDPVGFNRSITSLSPGTTYYYCAIASNTFGTAFGEVLSFTTPPNAPSVSTNPPSMLTGTTAQLNGSANPGGGTTSAWFRYATSSPGSCNDTFGTRAPGTDGSSLGSGTSSVSFSQGISGLTPATTYFYCAIATNSAGTSFGIVRSFTTPTPPVVTTQAASSVTSTGARLNGTATPNGATTTGYFRFSLTNPGTCNDTFGSRAPGTGGSSLGSGFSASSFSQNISGLSFGTTYYYCAIATNSEGTSFGAVLSFTTAASPSTTTVAATGVSSSGATLNGSANPNGSSSFGYFRYSTTDPGTCSDSWGTRWPTSSGSDSSLGAGSIEAPFNRSLSSLVPATTYYFCAAARNSFGTNFGEVLSFTTGAAAPTVSTGSASSLTGSTAQLNGTSNPGGSETTAWFRYSSSSPGTCNDTFGTRAPTAGGSALGAGTSSVAFNQGITGLSPSTTYYYCAIAQNAVGTVLGTLRNFTTPSTPTVTTLGATSVTSTSATLNGSGIPNGSSTTGYFRYALTDPGTCNDTFGSRAPSTGGSSLGTGSSSVSFNRSISGLSPETVYYYCAIATSAEGTSFGEVLTFRTPGPPIVTTNPATLVSASGATVNGSANPNGNSTFGYFRYSTTNPGTCSDSFGTRWPSSSGSDTSLGAALSDVDYSRALPSLLPGTTYYFCAIARNTYGTRFGEVLSFTTDAAPPTVSTGTASSLTGTTAQLNGSANPGGTTTTAWFRYSTASPGTCNDTFGTRAPTTGGSALGAGTSAVSFNQGITGLAPNTTYFFCAIAQNAEGTAFGTVRTFTTPSTPTVTTLAATSVTATSATLNGSGIPNGSATTGYFRYGLTNPGTCSDTFGSRAPSTGGSSLGSGTSAISFNRSISGLSAETTYYYCAVASSAEGTSFGEVRSFRTPGAPIVSTNPPTAVTSAGATFQGTANPNGSSSFGYFRYGTTSPGTCSDSFGTRWPSSSGSDTSLGSATSDVPYSRTISGLLPGTTYYVCAAARNSFGTRFGAVLSFTTNPALPSVSTGSATSLTGTTAQLNGTVNPNGAATTAWFRYGTASPGSCNDSFGTRAPSAGGSSIAAGTTSSSFSQGITGLSPSTTYYYCAIGQNSAGTTFGAVRSFTTPTTPTVTTAAVSSLTNSSVRLNGTATPNGASTTGYFRYSLTNPTTCNDTFGSRAPGSGGSSIGTGTTAVAFNQTVSGLSANTTYYYCAIASSAEGTAFGEVLSFTTADAPTVTTLAATDVTSGGARFNGSANPNRNSSFGYFRYATTNPGTCSDSFGSRWPSSSGSDTSLGAGSSDVGYNRSISGLPPGTTYYFCAIARNSYGTVFGEVLSFTTAPNAPAVTTGSASSLTGTTARLNGTVNPGGTATTAWFRFATVSPGTCNDTFGTRAPTVGGSSAGSGTSSTSFNQAITGLTPNTTYYYCAIATNAVGTAFGSVRSFTTPTVPFVTTNAATSITNSSATLNGAGTPNGASTLGYFRFGLTNPGTCNDTFGSRAPDTSGSSLGSGTTSQSFSRSISGLSAATTYYYCAIATSAEGTAFGEVRSFTTAGPPIVTTLAATPVSSTGATLNGRASPNGSSAFGYFRYSSTNPVTCTDGFGTRAPPSSGSDTSLGSGTTETNFSRAISGLLPGSTYYFCAIARSAYGTSYGPVLSFTTPAAAPIVSTLSASGLGTTSATLNGSGNPNGDSTTGWFRYATSSPGTCNDTFGTRVPATGGISLGSGTSSVSFSQMISGLTPSTTYYYCAIVSSSTGTALGTVRAFTTPSAPSVATLAATPVTATSATLNASIDPNGFATTGWFRFSTTSPGACNTTFGSATATVSLGSGTTAAPLSTNITALSPATTYYFCAIAQSAFGTTLGEVLAFTTPAAPPAVVTQGASGIGPDGAVLDGTGNPNGSPATGHFRYATTNPGTCNDTFGTRAPASGGTSLGMGNSPVPFTQSLTGLTLGTTYYYCAIVTNGVGITFGSVQSFVTTAAPSVTTAAASGVASTTATLDGSANPNASPSTGWFRYGVTDPGSCNDSFGTRAPSSGGTALGSGASPVAYTQTLTGLTPGATYYYCAIASNGSGTGFGAVQSFTTAARPTVTTTAASAVTATSATLEGTANPNLSSATGWFRYATANPGSCNDSFGIRTPTTGGTTLGAGDTPVTYTRGITGLSAGTTYYYCAMASNTVGTSFGTVESFTTPAAPTVTTTPATGLTASSATLNGSANPNLTAATGHFRYSTTNPGACDDTFGTRAPATGGLALGAGASAVPFSEAVVGLAPSTTYYYCAIATNGVGVGVGEVQSFTTPAAPAVTTVAATGVTSDSATLGGSANPSLSEATGWFRFDTVDPGTCSDAFGTRAPASGGVALGAGSTAVPYTQALSGLLPGTTYYYCAVASNAVGTRFGAVLSFTTADAPTVTTELATSIASTTATVNGTANPNRDATTGWFRYAATDPGSCTDSFGTRAPATGGTALGAGPTVAPYAQPLTGLSPGTTYYYCAIASNSSGTRFGTVRSFTTASAPSVSTAMATAITSSSATLNGSANPNLSAATGSFRYATTNPGTCNDTFGTRAPSSGGTGLGAGSAPVAYSEVLTGLAASTTYYYCAIATNSVGTAFGEVLSFTTAGVPTVVTEAATAVTSTGATLRGSASPNLADATGWFRYSTTDPGTCNGSFGTRAPLVGGTALGAGASPVGYSQVVAGLMPGTTYYYCAMAANSTGTGFGTVMSFSTPSVPTVTTDAATAVATTAATLRGSANPNMADATGWFRYDTTDPGTCSDVFGTRAPSTGGTPLGAGSSPVAYTQMLSGLAPNTTYYYCAIASNPSGTAFGVVMSFTTTDAPAVTTLPATALSRTGATLNGTANPNRSDATGWFRYADVHPGACDDTFGTRAPDAGGTALGAGSADAAFAQVLAGLTPGVTYHYCAIAANTSGTRFGEIVSFTTPDAPSAPTVVTDEVTEIADRAATLEGSATPNLADATGWFRYDTTDPGACNDSFGTRAPLTGGAALGDGGSPVPFAEAIADLAPGTTYYVCAIASNSEGTRFGEVQTFTTAPSAPEVTTAAATEVMSDSALLNGSALPNGEATVGWFRYDTDDPGACDDTFGTRAPTSGAAALGAGTDAVPFSELVTGLSGSTVYHYCAIADNAMGIALGVLLTFMPGVSPPTVTTGSANDVEGTAATLAGSANPNGSDAVGWFRYGTEEPATCDDAFGMRAPATGEVALGAGTEAAPFTEALEGLAPNTTYYYCAAASNLGGASFGEVRSFTTGALPPTVRTTEPMIGDIVTLTGAANPQGSATSVWFRYDTSDPGTCDDTFGMRAPSTQAIAIGSGLTEETVMEPVGGLLPGTYYVCAIAENEGGIAFGEMVRFEVAERPSTAGGCGCRVGGSSGEGLPLASLGALAVLALAVRRRRRRG